MALNLNKLVFAGRLTKDPSLRYLPNNMAVCTFSVACNRKFKNSAGEQQDEATFLEFEAWSKTAEAINQYFRKGSAIYTESRLKLDTWEDKQSGEKRSKTVCVLEKFEFLDPKNSGNSQADGNTRQESSGYEKGKLSKIMGLGKGSHAPVDDGDIPF